MDDITFKISGSLTVPLKRAMIELPSAERRALYHAAYFLRDKVRQSIVTNVPKATVRNPKYNDTLVDAVMFTRPDGASITLHALGNRKKGSGTFRTRFFEIGTKDRYQKTRNGVKLKRKKYVGKLKPTYFFRSAVNANREGVTNAMREILDRYITKCFEN